MILMSNFGYALTAEISLFLPSGNYNDYLPAFFHNRQAI